MVFTSFNFLIFFPIVIIIYYVIPRQSRAIFLLLASYFFYININPVYVLLLAGITLSTYIFTILIERAKSEKNKKSILIVNIIITLLPLFFFKYYNFVNAGVFDLLQQAGLRWPLPGISFLLPIGISFYTFMAIGYSIDVYNEEINAEKNFVIVALFLSFFPIMLSGPIERATNLFPQFKKIPGITYDKIVKGLQLILWGYFMKLVVADRIAILLHTIYQYVELHSGITLLMAVLLYPIQVYADLGGYSLIAIGAANVMGIDVIANFRRPFFATSMSDFWRRWHISLISWLTDYIYIPLSYSLRRYKKWGIVMALMLTFLISGIWHGAAFTFIFWGLLQGTFLSIEAVTVKQRKNIIKKYDLNKRWWYIFLCCCFTYLLFAFSEIFCGPVDTMSKGFYVIKKIFTEFNGPLYYDTKSMLFFLIVGIFSLFFVEYRMEHGARGFFLLNNKSLFVRVLLYALLIVVILLIGVFDGGQFIYFRF